MPLALLALVDRHLSLLFLLFKQDHAMGLREHPTTDNRVFAFEGKIIGTQGYLVELLDDSFNLTGPAPYGSYVRCSPYHGGLNDKLNLHF